MNWRGMLKVAGWLAIPVLLGWALWQAPLPAIFNTLAALHPPQILALIAANLLIFMLFNSRWWWLLRLQGQRLPFSALLRYRLAGFALSYFTPGTQFGGEPLQVYLLQNRHQVPASVAIATVMLDKLFELLANFTFLAAGLILMLTGGLAASLHYPLALAGIGFLLAAPLVYLLALWAGRFPLTGLVVRLPARLTRQGWRQRISPLIGSSERQISSLCRRQPAAMLAILALSGLILGLMLAEYWLMLTCLGLSLSLNQTIHAFTTARLAFLTPLPAGAGALEASQVFALQALGAGPVLGLSLSLMIRGRDLLLGGLGLWQVGALTAKKQAGSAAAARRSRLPLAAGRPRVLEPVTETPVEERRFLHLKED